MEKGPVALMTHLPFIFLQPTPRLCSLHRAEVDGNVYLFPFKSQRLKKKVFILKFKLQLAACSMTHLIAPPNALVLHCLQPPVQTLLSQPRFSPSGDRQVVWLLWTPLLSRRFCGIRKKENTKVPPNGKIKETFLPDYLCGGGEARGGLLVTPLGQQQEFRAPGFSPCPGPSTPAPGGAGLGGTEAAMGRCRGGPPGDAVAPPEVRWPRPAARHAAPGLWADLPDRC